MGESVVVCLRIKRLYGVLKEGERIFVMKLVGHLRYVLLSLCAGASLTHGAWGQSVVESTAGATVAEQYLLAAANQERAAQGLGPLHRDAGLARAAAHHAEVMAAHGTISHQFPGEAELTARGASAGVRFSVISENVGEAPSAVTLHDLWMHSEGHRRNLLDPSVDAAGISVVARGGQLYAVEDFAKTVRALSFDAQEASVAAMVAKTGVQTVDTDAGLTAVARKTCAMDTGYAGSRKPWFVMRFTAGSLTALPQELKTRIASGKYREAVVGACAGPSSGSFSAYSIAVLLYP
jgi:Cysteine-rich secretory protein family